MQLAYQLVYIVLELVIACLAVAGNVLVCCAVCLNSNLQSVTNFFVVSLAVADIAVGLLAIPSAIAISIGFCANFHGCLFMACFLLVLTQSSIFSLLAIAIDRYIAIKCPLRYNSLVTGPRAKGIISVCWILSIGIGLTPMGWNKGENLMGSSCPPGMTQCLFEEVVTLNYMVYFNFFGCVLAPLVAMLAIYVRIFMAARRQLLLVDHKLAHVRAQRKSSVPGSSPGSSRTLLQKEVHAAKSLAIIVGLFALCWLPLHVLNCYNLLCRGCDHVDVWAMNFAIVLSHGNSVVNPVIYAYRLREFRHTFRRILRRLVPDRGSGWGGASVSVSNGRAGDPSPCDTVVNSYTLEAGPTELPRGANQHWTAKLHLGAISFTSTGTRGTLEEKDGGGGVFFVNLKPRML